MPACPADLYGRPLHYHRYEIRSDVDRAFQLWRETAELVRFESVALPRISAESKPAGIWLTLHATPMQLMQDGVWLGMFGLRLTLRLPSSYAAPVSP